MSKTQTIIAGFIHGKFPRSADLVEISRDVDRKRRKPSDLKKQYKTDLVELLKAQKTAPLDFVSDGKLPWQDIFRPIVQTSKGFTTGPLTRWFDNNCFFRQPIITGKISVDVKELAPSFAKISPSKQWHVTLPSPFTFAKLSDDTTTKNFAETLEHITDLLITIIKDLDKKGVAIIQLNEPYIPYVQPSQKELELFKKSIAKMYGVKLKAKLAIHFYFGDAKNILELLAKEKIADIVGIDFYKTNLSDIPANFPYDIIAGVFDGRNSLLEKEIVLKKFIKQIIKKQKPNTVYISNSSDLELLPEPVAKEKIKILRKLLQTL